MPTLQIATFPVSEAFLSNPEIFKAPMDVIKTAEGHISSFYGLKVEDKKSAYFVTVWESYEHHKRLIGESGYATIIEALKPAVAGKLERYHIDVTADANTTLSAPASEFVVFTLKPDATPEKLVPLLEELGKGLDTAAGAHPPCMWAQSIEDKTKFLLIVGWDTVEAHWEAVKEGTELHATVGKIVAVADLVIGHAHVVKHQG
ncbi:hypothetical protein B0H15DRAFT_71903 [Mycena belliarum]|uniref:ABM domain-containing protein n=1 Tax=Mycena belliarum TaxID=1033014 RepID=A0AAD6XQG1_9AGAR|nr:hypothetical protein B0H15DRAFT_71903 [Mycena belliae]